MSNNSPLVTVILPVYNGEKTLKETLESLLQQTFADFELLVGIDGSKDGSKNIAETFNDERIQIFENLVNIGLGPNVNKLISLANSSSKYIAMAEQDDVYVPERLEWQLEVMSNHPEVGLVSGIAEFMGDGGTVLFPGILVDGKQFPQGKALFTYLYEQQLKVVNTCIFWRKEVHQTKQLGFKNTYGNFNADWDFVLRFSLVSQVYGIPKVLVHMNRKKQHGSVTTNKATQHQASRQLLKDFKAEFTELVSDTLYKKALKQHRKIELGHHSKFGIVLYGLYYTLYYSDSYFLKYIVQRFKIYLNG